MPDDVPDILAPDQPADRRRRERMARSYLGDDVDPSVAQAMAALPRHWFVPPDLLPRAYDDHALPIGAGQTISQPRVVAAMLSALGLGPGTRVLDVGAGSGYATALIAQLVAPATVLALERQGPLVGRTALVLGACAPSARLELRDGLLGAPEHAPFDAIHVACACESLPQALVDQLAPGGCLVIPLGPHGGTQVLTRLERTTDGSLHQRTLGDVLFVPGLPGVTG